MTPPLWLLEVLTRAGEAAPLALVMLLWVALLWAQGRRAGAKSLLIALLVVAAGIVCAKLLLMSRLITLHGFDLVSPSGHAAMSLFAYGALALGFGTGRGRGVAVAAWACAVLFAVSIAASRIYLDYHSGGEVLLGLAIGVVGLALVARQRMNLMLPGPVALAMLVLIALLAWLAPRLNVEWMLYRISRLIRGA